MADRVGKKVSYVSPFNIAAVAAVMGAGFYMILSGKKPKIPLISN
jgi:hypothetical protein